MLKVLFASLASLVLLANQATAITYIPYTLGAVGGIQTVVLSTGAVSSHSATPTTGEAPYALDLSYRTSDGCFYFFNTDTTICPNANGISKVTRVSPFTFTQVGHFTTSVGTLRGMAWDNTNNVLYMLHIPANFHMLLETVDVTTGTLTLVHDYGVSVALKSLAFDASGNLFTIYGGSTGTPTFNQIATLGSVGSLGSLTVYGTASTVADHVFIKNPQSLGIVSYSRITSVFGGGSQTDWYDFNTSTAATSHLSTSSNYGSFGTSYAPQ